MHIQNHLYWWTKCAKTKFKLYKHVHQLLCKISLFRVSSMEKSETTTTAPCLDDFPLSNNNVTTKSSQWMKSSQICPNHTLHIPCLTNSCNSHLFSIGKQLVLNAQHTPVIPNSDTKCRHYIFIQTPTCLKSLEWLLVLGYNNLKPLSMYAMRMVQVGEHGKESEGWTQDVCYEEFSCCWSCDKLKPLPKNVTSWGGGVIFFAKYTEHVVSFMESDCALQVDTGIQLGTRRQYVCCEEFSCCRGCDKLKPLPECITKNLRQGVDVSQDDVEWEWKLPHVKSEFGHLKKKRA